MNKRFLENQIRVQKEKLIRLASQKQNPLRDPEVYRKSCELDYWVVEYTKMQRDKFKL